MIQPPGARRPAEAGLDPASYGDALAAEVEALRVTRRGRSGAGSSGSPALPLRPRSRRRPRPPVPSRRRPLR